MLAKRNASDNKSLFYWVIFFLPIVFRKWEKHFQIQEFKKVTISKDNNKETSVIRIKP